MRLSGGVAILGEGLETVDEEPVEDAQRGPLPEEPAGAEVEAVQEESDSTAPR